MTDFHEIIRNLQNELDEAKEQIQRKDKQILTAKNTNKIQEGHTETLRKKIAQLQSKRPSIIPEDDPRVPELNGKIDKLNHQVQQLQKENNTLKELRRKIEYDLNKCEVQCIKYQAQCKQMTEKNNSQKILNRFSQQVEQKSASYKQNIQNLQKKINDLQKTIESLQSDLTKSKKSISNLDTELIKGKKIISDNEKKISNLEVQLTKSKRAISELQKSRQSSIKESKKEVESEEKDTILSEAPSVNESSNAQFYQGVFLSQSMNENHIQIPSTHQKLFDLLNIYLTRLMPGQKIKFLNTIVTDAENKLDKIDQNLNMLSDQ